MIQDYFMIAFKSLTQRKLRSWLTMIGIFIGIATIVALVSLGQGLKVAVMGQFSFLTPDLISVTASAGGPFVETINPITTDDLKVIEKTPGIEVAAGRLMSPVRFEFHDTVGGAMLASIPYGNYRDAVYDILSLRLDSGSLLKDADEHRVMLGYEIANSNDLDKSIRPGDTIIIEGNDFQVTGIIEKKGTYTIDYLIAMNEDAFRHLLDVEDDTFNVVGARAKDQNDVPEIIDEIEKRLRKSRGVKERNQDFVVEAALDNLEMIESTMFGVQLFIYIIAGVSIVVGGIGIMNTMYTSVLERTKEIGIMKAIGARNATIFTLFFIESGLLGMVGGLFGILFGMLLGMIVSEAGKAALGSDLIGAHFSLSLILGSLLFSFLLGSLSGILPALQASKLHPVQALAKGK